jgi:hypothetical protein
MKKKLLIVFSVLVILTMLVTVSPVSAQATKTEVTGTYYFVDEYHGENFREWTSDHYITHTRNEIIVLRFETSDPRTDGYYKADVNLDSGFSIDGKYLFGHNWSTNTMMYEDEELTVPKWECQFSGHWASDFSSTAHTVCHGLGANEGLIWIDDGYAASPFDPFTLVSVIIDPGK